MLYLLRAHCFVGRVIYFQQKNKSVDLGLIIQTNENKIRDYKEQILCFLLDPSLENQFVKTLLYFCKFTFPMEADTKSMPTTRTPNEGCQQGKPSQCDNS